MTLYEQLIADIAQDIFDRLETAQEEMERLSPEALRRHLAKTERLLSALWEVAWQTSPVAAMVISDSQERVREAIERLET